MTLEFKQATRVVDEQGNMGQWVHVSLEQVTDLFPHVQFSRFCETPRHAAHRIPAALFHAVFYDKRVELWVSCWECYQLMLRVQI